MRTTAVGIRIRNRQSPLTANVPASTPKIAPGPANPASAPATAGPAIVVSDSATRSTALPRCTSGAISGSMLATPGWKTAAPSPPSALSA